MEIEVKQPQGYYLRAVVSDIKESSLDVVYDRGWKKPDQVEFDRCRAVITEAAQKQDFKGGDLVDAFVRIDKNDKEEMQGWMRMKIREIKSDFAVVDSVESHPAVTDVIPVQNCRHPALASPITPSCIKTCSFAVPNEANLLEYFSRGEESLKMLQESVPNILVKYDPSSKQIVAKSFSATAIKKVSILQEAFLTNSRQKMLWLSRQEETKKMLAATEPSQQTNFVVEFCVDTAFMGLAIGSHGANISNARKIEGVKEINVDETQRLQGTCKFKVFADTADAAEQARNILEFLQQHVKVPHDKVGQVIGKQGKTIQDIVDKSGVVRVQIGDESAETDGLVDFTFTGTREAISNAQLMVEFHLKHIKEMDEIRLEEEEIKRKLYHSRSSPFQSFNNGHSQYQQHNSNARAFNGGQEGGNRRGGGGGGYRGGAAGRPTGRFSAAANAGGRPGGYSGGGGGPRGGQFGQGQQHHQNRGRQQYGGTHQQYKGDQQKQREQEKNAVDAESEEDSKSDENSSANSANSQANQQHSQKKTGPAKNAGSNRYNTNTGGFSGQSHRSQVPQRNRRNNNADEE